MPLLIICGQACGGKSGIANRLVTHFTKESTPEDSVHLISDESFYSSSGKDRNTVYGSPGLEKQMRGQLKDKVTRVLSANKLVILDAQNYIKGFRYELYCVVKAAKTTQCVLFLNCPLDQSLTHNETSKLYSEETIKALHLRFEAPQNTARWDSPLFETSPENVHELDLQMVEQSLTSGRALPPNLSTQNPPRLAADTLYDLDKMTQKLTSQIMGQMLNAEIGDVLLLSSKLSDDLIISEKLKVNKKLSMPELQRIRRHFLDFYKSHTFKDRSQVPNVFFQFVSNAML